MTGIAKLERYGLLRAAGEDARVFLHAQLTNDIENLLPGQARYAGWCSAKGRLLATFLVVPYSGGFLLQLSRDLVPAVAKRLSMFVLRAKLKITDVSAEWGQFGQWSDGSPNPLGVQEQDGAITVGIEPGRSLVLAPANKRVPTLPEEQWTLAEVRAGRALIEQPTQDQFVPQMVNLELAGGVDFRKGCYPGQELYSDDAPGQPSGVVVNAAGDESLAVLQTSAVEAKSKIRAQPQAAALEVLPLPYPR